MFKTENAIEDIRVKGWYVNQVQNLSSRISPFCIARLELSPTSEVHLSFGERIKRENADGRKVCKMTWSWLARYYRLLQFWTKSN